LNSRVGNSSSTSSSGGGGGSKLRERERRLFFFLGRAWIFGILLFIFVCFHFICLFVYLFIYLLLQAKWQSSIGRRCIKK
jgi:hypothetical protein